MNGFWELKIKAWRIRLRWAGAVRRSSCEPAIKASKIALRSAHKRSKPSFEYFLHFRPLLLLPTFVWSFRASHESIQSNFFFFGSKSRWSNGNLIGDCGFLFVLNELCWMIFSSLHSLELAALVIPLLFSRVCWLLIFIVEIKNSEWSELQLSPVVLVV